VKDKGKVLLVDDDDVLRASYWEYLCAVGFEVYQCRNAEEALTCGFQPDILLTDVMMPGISGRQLADQLRAIDPLLRIIFISGYSGDKLSGMVFDSKMTKFLQKPFSLKVLAAEIADMLDSDNTAAHAPS